jgi:hypothetical protein
VEGRWVSSCILLPSINSDRQIHYLAHKTFEDRYQSGLHVRVARSLVLQIVVFFPFACFLLAIALTVLLRFTAYDYPFGIYLQMFYGQDNEFVDHY